MAFKYAEKAPQKPRKCLKNCHFSAINIEINFGYDRRRIGFRRVLTAAQIFFAWNHKVTGDAQGRAYRNEGQGKVIQVRVKARIGARPGTSRGPRLGADVQDWGRALTIRNDPQAKVEVRAPVPKRWYFCTSEQSEAAKKCRNSPYFKTGTWAHIYEVYILLFPRPVFYMFT